MDTKYILKRTSLFFVIYLSTPALAYGESGDIGGYLAVFIHIMIWLGVALYFIIKIMKSEKHNINKLFTSVFNNLHSIILLAGGIIISLRLIFPPQYAVDAFGRRIPYDNSSLFAPTSDYETAILHSLGVAVVTGVIYFILRKTKK